MSEKINNEDVLCGAIYENGEYVPVYCNRVTGECYFADPVMSYNRLISELSVDDPIEVDFPDTVEAIVSGSFGECLGLTRKLSKDFTVFFGINKGTSRIE